MAVLSDAQREAGWTAQRLSDVIDLVGGGTPKTTIEAYWNGSIPWLSVVDFSGDKRYVSQASKSITQEGLDNSSTKLLSPGDLIISARGTVGEIAQLTEPMAFNQSCFGIRSKTDSLNQNYLYYLLLTVIYELRQNSHGSIFSTINRKTFEAIDVLLPPLEEQERIAGILGSLDDKIEANTRLIGTMEDYIHAVIKKISESNSFKRVAIKDLAIHEKNQELPREHVEGAIHHYSLPAYDSGKTPGIEEAESIKSNKFIIDKPCVLFSKLNPGTPRIWFVKPEDGIRSYASTEFIVLTPKENVDIANLWATCSEERISQNLADMASGTSTSHQRVRPADILNSKVLDLNDQSEIRSITSYIEALRKENLQLAATRDALIKRLIG